MGCITSPHLNLVRVLSSSSVTGYRMLMLWLSAPWCVALLALLAPLAPLAAAAAGAARADPAALRGGGARPVPPGLQRPPVVPSVPPNQMEALLGPACAHHKDQFDALARARTQLVLDIFFGGMGTPLLPAHGTLLGVQRHGLLCAPWDDDLDFTIGTAEFDALLVREKPLALGALSSVEDISASELGRALAAQTRATARCVVGDERICPKIITLRVTNPGAAARGSTGTATALDPLIRAYFTAQPLEENVICLSLVFLKWGFVKILAWENQCATGASRMPKKVTDLFPSSYVWDFTCGQKDYRNGVPSPRCIAHALIQQPNLTATARFLTVEGDVELLSPVDEYAHQFLAGQYGKNWDTQAVICGHTKYSDYELCSKGESGYDLDQIRAVMSTLPECDGLDGTDVGSVGRRQEARMLQASASPESVLRQTTYLGVARTELDSRDRWTEIFYYADDQRGGGKTLRKLNTLGLVSRANDVHTEAFGRSAGGSAYAKLFFGLESQYDMRKKQRREKAVDAIPMTISAT